MRNDGGNARDPDQAAQDAGLDLFEQVLAEDDHDLYQWVSGQRQAPDYMRDFAAELAADLRA